MTTSSPLILALSKGALGPDRGEVDPRGQTTSIAFAARSPYVLSLT